MRFRTAFLFVFLSPLAVTAAEAPPDIVSVLEPAQKAPGEFAADSLIRLASLTSLDKTKRVALLEEAFRRAGEAKQPLKRRVAITRVAGPARFLTRAYNQDLDRLSLELRVIEALLPLEAGKARELALKIAPPEVPKTTCSEFQTYDLDRLYTVLGDVARKAYTAKEAERGGPLRLLHPQLAALTAPVEVGPAAQMLAEVSLGDRNFETLLADFEQALRNMVGDDRSFAAVESTLGPRIETLVHACQRRSISTLPLLEAYRLFLVNHLAGARCEDDDLLQPLLEGTTAAVGGGFADPQAPRVVEFFNERLQVSPLQPLTETDVTPSHVSGRAAGLEACRDSGCKEAAGLYTKLYTDGKGAVLSDAERRTPDWQSTFHEFLEALSHNWNDGGGADALDTFSEKCEYYSQALQLAPEPAGKELVERAWLEFVEQSNEMRNDPPVWFLPIRQMMARARIDQTAMQKAADDLKRSKDPVIALYLALESVAPQSPAELILLL